MFAALVNRAWEVKHSDAKKGMSQQFEEHVRCLMATGSTARQTREGLILTAGQFLEDEECADYRSQIPIVEWFAKQREALGVESYLYTFMKIAGAESVRQWGFDETKIDGHDTFNQWAMLIYPTKHEDEGPKEATIVTLECAAVLPSSEAEDVVLHIEEVWRRGKAAIDALRAALGPDLQDVLCPLMNGGVSLHKLYGVMHDTCNCANLVRSLIILFATLPCFLTHNPYTLGGKTDATSEGEKMPGTLWGRCMGCCRTES